MCAQMQNTQLQSIIDQATNLRVEESDRIDACHKLGHISHAAAVEALVKSLEDPVFAVRWAAAEALVQHGSHGIEAVLQALVQRPSQFLYTGAHHVLKQTLGHVPVEIVQPVIEALEGVGAAAITPKAAHVALTQLESYHRRLE